jgi:hypothetical protein
MSVAFAAVLTPATPIRWSHRLLAIAAAPVSGAAWLVAEKLGVVQGWMVTNLGVSADYANMVCWYLAWYGLYVLAMMPELWWLIPFQGVFSFYIWYFGVWSLVAW